MSIRLEDYVVDQHGDIKLLDGYRLVYLDEAGIYGDVDPYSDEGIELFRAWLVEAGVSSYSRTREDFFMFEAWAQAEEEGNNYLVVEDLS